MERDDQPVDEDEGLPIPQNEEQAKQQPTSEEEQREEQAKAAEVAADPSVGGNTEIPGTGGGVRFFGAAPQ
jgi:hypothetical protein